LYPGRILPALLCSVLSGLPHVVAAEKVDAGGLSAFSTIFEPSGVVHLGKGEFIVVEDEPGHPFHGIKIDSDGVLIESGMLEIIGEPVRLNDLEGVTFDGRYLYAITSHSRTKKGKTGKDRSVLVRFEYEDGQLRNMRRVDDLKAQIISLFSSELAGKAAAQIEAEINLEALTWSPKDKSLYIGFREPRMNGKSAIMLIQAPGLMFEQQSAENISTQLFWLDLQDKGIRSMNWDTTLQRFIIVAGEKKADTGFGLWQWQANPESAAIRITSSQEPLPDGTEGLATFVRADQSGMLLVIDDGSEKKSRPGHYQLFPFGSR
jgi:hypothetical protein